MKSKCQLLKQNHEAKTQSLNNENVIHYTGQREEMRGRMKERKYLHFENSFICCSHKECVMFRCLNTYIINK